MIIELFFYLKLLFKRELLSQLREYGMKITSALPLQFIVGNIVRRILNIVREEYTAARKVNDFIFYFEKMFLNN